MSNLTKLAVLLKVKHMAGKHPQKTHDPHKGSVGSSSAVSHKQVKSEVTKLFKLKKLNSSGTVFGSLEKAFGDEKKVLEDAGFKLVGRESKNLGQSLNVHKYQKGNTIVRVTPSTNPKKSLTRFMFVDADSGMIAE